MGILPCNLLFLLVGGYCKISSGLQVSSIYLLVFTIASLLQSLGLDKHRLFLLLEDSLLLFELERFMALYDFHSCMLDCLTDEHLQDWFSFDIEVEQAQLFVIKLDGLIVAVLVWHELGSSWLVDVEVSWNRVFIHHVVLVVQRRPVRVLRRWALELRLLRLNLVESCLLGHLFLLLCDLLLQLLLLFQPFQLVSLSLLLCPFLLCLYRVRLHI